MSHEERRAWQLLVITVIGVVGYVVVVLSRADGGPLVDVAYQPVMLWSIGLAIAVSIVIDIALSIVLRDGANEKDQRDAEIAHFSSRMANASLVIGAVVALLLALVEADWFWIANALYLGFAISAITESAVRIISYRSGFPQW